MPQPRNAPLRHKGTAAVNFLCNAAAVSQESPSMVRKRFAAKAAVLALAGLSLAGCATTQTMNVHRYAVRQIGSTVLIEPVSRATASAIAGAVIGTAIAARFQSQPIPLKPGTDYACKYQVAVKTCIGDVQN